MSSAARKNETQTFFEPSPFRIGDIVRHAVFGYRGVIVRRDDRFAGPDGASHPANSQPSKDQPWYQILIDDSESMTYVAEAQLTLDPSEEPIDHPLTHVYFEKFENGKYSRTLH